MMKKLALILIPISIIFIIILVIIVMTVGEGNVIKNTFSAPSCHQACFLGIEPNRVEPQNNVV